MKSLKTIAIDIRESVFNNDSEGILYITKDIYSDSYIISVPSCSFSATVSYESEERTENDYEWIRDHFPDIEGDYRDNLIKAIREGVEEFYGVV